MFGFEKIYRNPRKDGEKMPKPEKIQMPKGPPCPEEW